MRVVSCTGALVRSIKTDPAMLFLLPWLMARRCSTALSRSVRVLVPSRRSARIGILLCAWLATITGSALGQTVCYKWTVSRAEGEFTSASAACAAAFAQYVAANYTTPGQEKPSNFGPQGSGPNYSCNAGFAGTGASIDNAVRVETACSTACTKPPGSCDGIANVNGQCETKGGYDLMDSIATGTYCKAGCTVQISRARMFFEINGTASSTNPVGHWYGYWYKFAYTGASCGAESPDPVPSTTSGTGDEITCPPGQTLVVINNNNYCAAQGSTESKGDGKAGYPSGTQPAPTPGATGLDPIKNRPNNFDPTKCTPPAIAGVDPAGGGTVCVTSSTSLTSTTTTNTGTTKGDLGEICKDNTVKGPGGCTTANGGGPTGGGTGGGTGGTGDGTGCGAPGEPPCKIDETGTKDEVKYGKEPDEYEKAMKEAIEKTTAAGDERNTKWDFMPQFPSASCTPFEVAGQTLDWCPIVPLAQEIVTFLYVAFGIGACVSMVRQAIASGA